MSEELNCAVSKRVRKLCRHPLLYYWSPVYKGFQNELNKAKIMVSGNLKERISYKKKITSSAKPSTFPTF